MITETTNRCPIKNVFCVKDKCSLWWEKHGCQVPFLKRSIKDIREFIAANAGGGGNDNVSKLRKETQRRAAP
jgi:hypothetical protein